MVVPYVDLTLDEPSRGIVQLTEVWKPGGPKIVLVIKVSSSVPSFRRVLIKPIPQGSGPVRGCAISLEDY